MSKDKLIALSLICLRTCLEALRIMHELTDYPSHGACGLAACKVESITNLETHLRMYLSELSRVFFKKDNLRSKNWWLSGFYSFCIQGIVRRGLMELIGDKQRNEVTNFSQWSWQALATRQYLCLALRLFAATSGTHDPLMKEYSPHDIISILKTNDEKVREEDFTAAQDAVKQGNWKSRGISSSMQYLQNLFQDNGEFLIGNTAGNNVQIDDRNRESNWTRFTVDKAHGESVPEQISQATFHRQELESAKRENEILKTKIRQLGSFDSPPSDVEL